MLGGLAGGERRGTGSRRRVVSTQRRQRQLASTWTARRRREKQFQARPGVIFRPAKQIAQFYYALVRIWALAAAPSCRDEISAPRGGSVLLCCTLHRPAVRRARAQATMRSDAPERP